MKKMICPNIHEDCRVCSHMKPHTEKEARSPCIGTCMSKGHIIECNCVECYVDLDYNLPKEMFEIKED